MKKDTKEILDFMETDTNRPVSFRELTRALKVPRDHRNSFKKTLKRMVEEGTVVKVRGGRYGLTKKMNLVTGTLSAHPDGFGFVIPDEDPEEKQKDGEKPEDVFIGARKFRGAMHGDKVVTRVDGYKPGGKREGSIVRVLTRAHHTIIGKLRKSKGSSIIIPSNERILNDIAVSRGQTKGATDGDLVEAEITRWPSKYEPALATIISVLGDPNDPDVEVEVIVRKYGLASSFPQDVMQEAGEIPARVGKADIKGRQDLRDKAIFTIDGETAKDFDDAISVERVGDGYRLSVSIADVSHYVKEGTALDKEAYGRSTSVYFPDRCVPMLPESLSNGICSLKPDVERLTLTAELLFNAQGEVTGKTFFESVIKSKERLTYTKVKTLLNPDTNNSDDCKLIEKYAHITEDLHVMRELALKLNKERVKDGSIDFDLPEPQIIIDIEGRVEDIVKSERNIAHRIIEEFMLAANRAVAELFSKKAYPFIYRIHDKPDPESITDFKEFAAGFGYDLGRSVTPKSFQQVLASAEGKPEEKLINHVLLRSMKQAVYSDENIGHFGLAFSDYTHFTSPIRRYPDLVVHRILRCFLLNKYDKQERTRIEKVLPEIAAHTSTRERNAMEAEREIVDLKKAQFMEDKVGEVYDGIISGVTSFGIFVELLEYFVEGLVHITALPNDYYTFVEKEHSLVGDNTGKRFRLGSEVRVKLTKVDIERRRIDMQLEGDSEGLPRPDQSFRGRRKKQSKKRSR